MSADRLKQIISERVADFSAEFCDAASFTDLAPVAIETFRTRWRQKLG